MAGVPASSRVRGVTAVRAWLGSRGCCSSAVRPNSDGASDYDYTNCTSKQYRWHKNQVLRQNRQNPDLEAKARLKECVLTLASLSEQCATPFWLICVVHVPLEEVRRGWVDARGRGLHQLRTTGTHCHVYQDVFGFEFRPLGFLSISYSDCHPVSWGNLIAAKHALNPPRVALLSQCLPSEYATLILTNPDGHLLDNTQELLHWMIMNIPVSGGRGNMEKGSTALAYLPPIPPKGTGFHRYVFSLYTHTTPLSGDSAPLPGDPTHVSEADKGWLQQRRFSSAEFMAAHKESGLKPWSFSFFQSQWDKSVSHTYKHSLNYAEPTYGPERRLGPRKTRQKEIYRVRQAKYTNL